MGKVAQRFLSEFTAAGLPADFVEQMNAAADALVAAHAQRTASVGASGGDSVGCLNAIADPQAMQVMLSALFAFA